MSEPKLTIGFMYEIMNYIGDLSVKHDTEVKALRQRIRDLECENGEMEEALARVGDEVNRNPDPALAIKNLKSVYGKMETA